MIYKPSNSMGFVPIMDLTKDRLGGINALTQDRELNNLSIIPVVGTWYCHAPTTNISPY